MSQGDFQKAAEIKHPKPRPGTTTLTVRLTAEERARLEGLAGDRPLSAFIRSRLFGRGGARKSHARRSTQDNELLAKILATLGRSNIATDLHLIGRAASNGDLAVTGDADLALKRACADVAAIRRDLIDALKLKPR